MKAMLIPSALISFLAERPCAYFIRFAGGIGSQFGGFCRFVAATSLKRVGRWADNEEWGGRIEYIVTRRNG